MLVSASGLTFRWILLLLLTLLVAFSPSGITDNSVIYLLIWSATIFKGWIIIEDFMELKNAPVFLRRILYGWLIVNTSAVTLVVIH